MIPNVVKGADLRGLMRYLVGPGRADEHTLPHVIGGDPFLQAWHGVEEFDQAAAAGIAGYLDQPRITLGTQFRGRLWRQNPETGNREPVLHAEGRHLDRDVNVWHCSLSLPAGEVLSSERWDAVTADFMDGMGFTGAGGKSPARWVAIHHGLSAGGNDHVHVVASMVREDGTRWDGRFLDFVKAQQTCRTLEVTHGLTPVMGGTAGTASRAVLPVEVAVQLRRDGQRPTSRQVSKAIRNGTATTARDALAQRVRSAAVGSLSEAEWLRRLDATGVVVKPRFAPGSTDVVVGYKAALKTGDGQPLQFYGGGQLGRDLSLPRIREAWPEPSVEAAGSAAAKWQAAFRGRPTGAKGREALPLRTGEPEGSARNLAEFVASSSRPRSRIGRAGPMRPGTLLAPCRRGHGSTLGTRVS